MENYYKPENLLFTDSKHHGKYQLVIKQYKTKEGYWSYSSGTVFIGDKQICAVQRNYPTFNYKFIENHPDGHDYLLCGAHYCGQTVVQLDTVVRKDCRKDRSEMCMYAYTPSEDMKKIAVEYCFWAGPPELMICDFSCPLELPWKTLNVLAYISGSVDKWDGDDLICTSEEEEIRYSDGKLANDISGFEVYGKNGYHPDSGYQIRKYRLKPDFTVENISIEKFKHGEVTT